MGLRKSRGSERQTGSACCWSHHPALTLHAGLYIILLLLDYYNRLIATHILLNAQVSRSALEQKVATQIILSDDGTTVIISLYYHNRTPSS